MSAAQKSECTNLVQCTTYFLDAFVA